MAQAASEFRPQLDTYTGPLDFLLFLIKKDEIDIFDIPVAKVIEQYRLYLDLLKEIDPSVCGDFLVLCAQLMEIKSRMLLPSTLGEDGEEELEDPRLDLVRQLLEFKKYKERSMLLEQRFEEFRQRYRRPHVPIPETEIDFSGPIFLGKLSVWDLLTAFQKVELAIGARGPHRVQLRERPISEYIEEIETTLRRSTAGSVRFESLFDGVTNRYDAIGLLLAVLEMAKGYRIALERDENADAEEITVRLRTSEERQQFREWLREEGLEGVADPVEALLVQGEGEEARAEPIETGEPGETGESSETIDGAGPGGRGREEEAGEVTEPGPDRPEGGARRDPGDSAS